MGEIANRKSRSKSRLRNQPYTLYPKTIKSTGAIYWYVEYRLPNGKFGTAKSTKQTTKSAALTVVNEYLRSGQITTKENMKFETFAKDFYSENSTYVKRRINLGKKFSKRQMDDQARKVHNKLIPYFGKYKLNAIDSDLIDAFINDLRNGNEKKNIRAISGDTINGNVAVLKRILQEAYRQKLIHELPMFERVPIDAKKRGALTFKEVKNLFSIPWENFNTDILNRYAFEASVGNLLAATSGLRQGEIMALTRKCIQAINIEISGKQQKGYFVNVEHSWDNIYCALKEPKTDKSKRLVPIAPIAYEALQTIMKKNKWKEPNDFIFQSDKRTQPFNPEIMRDAFYFMMTKLDPPINEAERKERNICFHSHRHFYNTFLQENGVSITETQAALGHTTLSMTANYLHIKDFKNIISLQSDTFGSTAISTKKAKK